MSDRVARLTALRRKRKSNQEHSEPKAKEEGVNPGNEISQSQALGQEKTVQALISASKELKKFKEEEAPDNENLGEDTETEQTETLSYNSDLKRDIAGLLSRSELATDNALKRIIREKFQQLQESQA